ncbi:MAG: hypothetical protein JO267_07135 [Alphaproteobacteria bacterium]|nr:hypothetical protein [Alphaproteobacteria bacterium]
MCGAARARRALNCPTCGHPAVNYRRWGFLGALIAVGAIAPAKTWLQHVSQTSGGLPRCESTLAEKEIERTVENSPAGHTRGIRVIAVLRPRLVKDEPAARHCSGAARLNSGDDVAIDFVFSRGNGSTPYFISVTRARQNPGAISGSI